MPVVVQPRLVVMVLPLEADGVCDWSFASGRFPDRLLRDTLRTVLRAPRNLAVLVGQLLRCAEVIALEPRDAVDLRRTRRRAPQRVFVLLVVIAVLGLVEQFDDVVAHRLCHRHNWYDALTGWEASAAGGPAARTLTPAQRALDAQARLATSRELGHERAQIMAMYLGR